MITFQGMRWIFVTFICCLLGSYTTQAIAKAFVHPPHRLKSTTPTLVPYGLSPKQVQKAYGFDRILNKGAGQIIGIVNAFDHATIESDLNVFSKEFGLPVCTTANGCFKKIYATGKKPAPNEMWGLETALDVEWAHAIAPQAKILLVEAAEPTFEDMDVAIKVAIRNGAKIISMSWGAFEFQQQTQYDRMFNIPGVIFLGASGDDGNGPFYPAASPYVLAVGGTTLTVDAAGNYVREAAWSGSGGGISIVEPIPFYQSQFPIPRNPGRKRGIPDVSYNGDPDTGVAVYDTALPDPGRGWLVLGGTSAGTPQWAALVAIVKSMAPSKNITINAIYAAAKARYTSNFIDIITGSNGNCGLNCTATRSYDYVTGLGSPQAANLIPYLAYQR